MLKLSTDSQVIDLGDAVVAWLKIGMLGVEQQLIKTLE